VPVHGELSVDEAGDDVDDGRDDHGAERIGHQRVGEQCARRNRGARRAVSET
jgi:hypothetical protein